MDVGLVCDACSALTPIGEPLCTRCGAAVALDPRHRPSPTPAKAPTTGKPPGTMIPPRPPGPPTPPAPAAPEAAATGETIACTKCSRQVGAGQRFCPHCGTRMPVPVNFEVETRVGPRPSAVHNAVSTQPHPVPPPVPPREPRESKPGRSTLFFGGAMQSARAKLTLIRGDGDDGVSFTLAGQDHLAGRGDCPISFPDDPFLSPVHANFAYASNQLVVRDQASLNGVYVRISAPTELANGAMVLVGEQVLSVERALQPEDLPDIDGTYYSASMLRSAALEIRQNLRGGQIGWVHRLAGAAITVGRENNDINFPDDPFISGRHAELKLTGDMLSVTDLGSRNGTFVRVQGERVLKHGDYVFLGQQLLRVEIV
jgi:pSer/pThr/pTyr-binding forkhead associated (FHA) protein/RNA polymerase subunit RPABC4/transcription elongation factor Spt4